MNTIRILSENDINKIINLPIAIKAVEEAYKQKSNMDGEVWPLVFYEYEHNIFDLDIRSGNLKGSNAYGLKLISYNENNKEKDIPVVNATAMIFNDKTGEPLAVLNAKPITSYRTGAAAAIGAKYLARTNSKNLLVIGCGNVAKYSVASTLYLLPTIENVYVYNAHRTIKEDELSSFSSEVEELIKKSKSSMNVSFYLVDDIEKITKNSDIIITATPSDKAIINSNWISRGTHLSCMGAGNTGKQEIDEKIFNIARSFADDENQCLNQGEAQYAHKNNNFNKFNGEIGDLILNKCDGRITNEDITIFDSTGLFLQDLATALELLKEANKNNIGTEIEI